jgi:hypothetical protein
MSTTTEITREIDLTSATIPGADRAVIGEAFRARAEAYARVGKFACAIEYLRLYDAVTPRDGSES